MYMSYSFEYIDIILLAMIAGFIFLRLRGILGKKTGFDEDVNSSFPHEAPKTKPSANLNADTFDETAKKEFLKGAQIAYETIITSFSNGKLKDIKSLLDKNPSPTETEIRFWLAGNLCRCTGYDKIVRAVQAASDKIKETA